MNLVNVLNSKVKNLPVPNEFVDSDFAVEAGQAKTESNYSCRSEYVYEGNGY